MILAQNGSAAVKLPVSGQVIALAHHLTSQADERAATTTTDKKLIMSTFKVTTATPSSNTNKDKKNKNTRKLSLNSSDKQKNERNSLESINSKCSISSGGNTNDDLPNQHLNGTTNENSNIIISNKQSSTSDSKQVVEARNRYVSPPVLAPNKDWPERGRCESASNRGRQLVALMSVSSLGANRKNDDDNSNNNNNNKNDGSSSYDGAERRPSQVGLKLERPETTDENGDQDEADEPPFMFAGILASMGGSVCFSFSYLFIKLLPEDSGGFEEKAKALFFRGLFMTILCSISIVSSRSTFLVPRDEIWVNAARALFGTLGAFGSYCALKYISIGDSTAIVFSSPIWTSILSHFILKENLQLIQVLALPISIFGIILIAHPGLIIDVEYLSFLTNNNSNNNNSLSQPIASVSSANLSLHEHHKHLVTAPVEEVSYTNSIEERWPGIVIAILVSFVVSGTYIVLKYRKKTRIQTTTFWLSITVTLSMFLYMCIFGFGQMPRGWTEWALLIGNGVASWLGQSAIQWAFLHETASVLSIMRTMDVACTFALSALFLDDDIYWTSILGSSVISLVVVSIVLSNWLQKVSCAKSVCKKKILNGSSSKQVASSNLVSDKLIIETLPGKERAAPYVISTSKI